MLRTILAALFIAAALYAQSATGPAGHWEGAIQTPGGDLNLEIDLAQEAGGWVGTISIPAQGTKGLGLIDVAVKSDSVSFGVKAPGDPRFQGTLAKEGGKISGELTQGGNTMPFQLTRTGEAKIEKAAKNPPLGKDLEGTWEGALDTPNMGQLHLRFVLANKDGAGTGVLFSVDQGNTEIPLGRIAQTGSKVNIEVPVVSGGFEGDLKDGKLTGNWSQGGGTLPLTLTRPAK